MSNLTKWLSNSVTVSPNERYRHRCLEENLDYRSQIIPELKSLVDKAHEDARIRIRDLLGNSLDPFTSKAPAPSSYPIDEYPKKCHLQTLKGCFGEIFAGLMAEKFSPFEIDWEIPAFPFRFHLSEFQQLEKLHQVEGKTEKRPGRTGEDLVAFGQP